MSPFTHGLVRLFCDHQMTLIWVNNLRVATILPSIVGHASSPKDTLVLLRLGEAEWQGQDSTKYVDLRSRRQQLKLLALLIVTRPLRSDPCGRVIVPHCANLFLRLLALAHGGHLALVEEGDLNIYPPPNHSDNLRRSLLAFISVLAEGIDRALPRRFFRYLRDLKTSPESVWFWPEKAQLIYCLEEVNYPQNVENVLCQPRLDSTPILQSEEWILALTAGDNSLQKTNNRRCLDAAKTLIPSGARIYVRPHPRSKLTFAQIRDEFADHRVVPADPRWLIENCASPNVITSSASIAALRERSGYLSVDFST